MIAEHLKVAYPKEMLLDRQITALGYKMSDIKYVVISHLHLDHTGYMHAFPNAKFLIMADEIRYAYWPEPHLRDVFVFKDIVPTRGFDWLELNGDFDIFGLHQCILNMVHKFDVSFGSLPVSHE